MNLWEKNHHSLLNILRLERRGLAREINKKTEYLPFPRANHEDWLPGYWIVSSPLPI